MKKRETIQEMVRRIIKEETGVDRMSKHNIDLDNRLKKYIKDNEPNISFDKYKASFMDEADPYNTKSPAAAFNEYTKLLTAFLKKHGY